jgi:hypothetical protein
VSSRLAVDGQGRQVVVVTTPAPFLQVGQRFPVVDELVKLNTWARSTGRPPTAQEMAQARPPYVDPRTGKRREERDEGDWMDEKAALEACRREQQREPVDLIGRVA